jgi:two-component system, cell cycle response regulator
MNPIDSKVLLVDDDPAILRLLSKWLQQAGYLVQTAADGQEALAAIEANHPDFLLTDWEMPHMTGVELCRAVRELNLPQYVYTLFLTVRSSSDEIVAGLQAGADSFLIKPVQQHELLARLQAGSRVLERERRLGVMARTDALTGLLTRRTFYDTLEKEWQRARRFHVPLSCVMLDVDFFKRVNDSHGHVAGDAVLKAVAALLQKDCRTSDCVCRYGGEEFCIMLPETSEQAAAQWAERTRGRMAALDVSVGDKEIRITGSFGIAQNHDDTQSPEELVDLADQALLCAKQSGRDRVVCYEALSDANELSLKDSAANGNLFQGILTRHVMTPLVACLRDDETIGQAAEFFLRSRINSTPLVDAQGKLCGMLSEKDLLAAIFSVDCWRRPVREVMRPHVICYDETTPIRTVYEFLCRVSIRRVVIVNDGRPTGTISRGTLLRWFRNLIYAKGLLEMDATPKPLELDPHRSRERLAETAGELARQASTLESRFQNNEYDLVPYVVGGATRMEELIDDLLAYSRYANTSSGLAAAMQSMSIDDSPLD